MNGKKANVVPVIRKETNRRYKTIGQSLYSLFAAKNLSVSFIAIFLTFLVRKI